MKIRRDTQQPPAVAELPEPKAEQAQQAAPARKRAARRPAADQVELSAPLNQTLEAQQEQQAQRVASIKARVEAGTYQVDSRKVAQKMLSGASRLPSPPDQEK